MALPLSYHYRHLLVRRTTTGLTVLVVAAVVSTLAWMLGFAAALGASLSVSSDRDKLIVLKPGATAESNSAIAIEDYNKLSQLADLARDPDSGDALLSPEMLVQVSLPRLRDAGRTRANVAIRGVLEIAFKVHPRVRLAEGRMFDVGSREVIVGRKASEQFAGLALGESVSLGASSNRDYEVVGIFTADGGPMESEIWGYLPSLMDAYNRSMYSSASLRLAPGASAAAVIERIEGPAIQLRALTERDYWDSQAMLIRVYLGIAYTLVFIMGLAAVFAIANTMFASVAARTREIAMLRTIGYSGWRVMGGFVLEAVLLALAGGVLGCAACWVWLTFVGNQKDMFGATTFTTLAFEIHLTPLIVAAALAAVSLVGALGALMPAWRAARLEVVGALREP